MKEGGKGTNLGSIMIPKARGVPNSFVSLLEDMSVGLARVGQTVHNLFFSRFHLCPGHRKGPEGKTYPTMDLLVHGELDGVNCILVEDCVCKL